MITASASPDDHYSNWWDQERNNNEVVNGRNKASIPPFNHMKSTETIQLEDRNKRNG